MKKILFFVLLCGLNFSFADTVKPEIAKMAVFADNTVFVAGKAVFSKDVKEIKFFDDTVFLKGSFAVWQDGITFSTAMVPQKVFSQNVLNDPNAAFAGQFVTVSLKSDTDNERIIQGKVIEIKNPDDEYFVSPVLAIEERNSGKITYVNVHSIETIRSGKADFFSMVNPARCQIFRRLNAEKELPFIYSYLTDGIVWQSSVVLDIISNDRMNIKHNAVIRNNGRKFACPEFYLVSGSPEIAMRNTVSLLSAFNQARPRSAAFLQKSAAADAVYMNSYSAAKESAAEEFMASSDVVYRPLGAFAMESGEARMIQIQSASDVPYRTAVKWVVPAYRNYLGKVVNHGRTKPYNSLIFKNTAPTMLDSASISIYADGRLIMQSVLDSNTYVNAERSIRLSDADGIECDAEEKEIIANREQNIAVNNRRYIRCTVEALLSLHNLRKEKSNVEIEYNFNGEFKKCTVNDVQISTDGASVSLLNPMNTLKTSVELNGNEKKEIKVTYTVLSSL